MEFSMEELVDLVETIGTRQTYLRKIMEPGMGFKQEHVQDAADELIRMCDLRIRFLEEIIKVRNKAGGGV